MPKPSSAASRRGRTPSPRATQLDLPFAKPVGERLGRRLLPILPEDMELVRTRNRVNLVSFRRTRRGTVIRISERLDDAPLEVLRSAVHWARGGPGSRSAAKRVRDYVRQLPPEPRGAPPPRLEPEGRWHDLATLLARARERWAPGVPVGAVGWAPARRQRRRRGSEVRLASYQEANRTIRVHPALDDRDVPAWVIEFLLFHELLHARLGSTTDRHGRVRYHTPEFNEAERAHPDFERYRRWEAGPFRRVLARWDQSRAS